MSGKMRNKKRRLAGSTDIPCESTENKISHSRVLRSSGKLIPFPSHAVVTTEPLTPTLSGALSPEMSCTLGVSYLVNTGKKKKSNMAERAGNSSSDLIHCSPPSCDGQLLDTINSETSREAMVLLTSENSFTPETLNQALIFACRQGHKQLVQTLVRAGANIEHRDEHGNRPLLICAEIGFTNIVQFLVSRHANVNAVNSVGNTALILSVRSAGSTDLTRFLLEQQDVVIHHENQNGHTALTRAAHFMDVDTLKLILEKSISNTFQKCGKIKIKQKIDFSFLSSRSQEIIEQFAVERTGFRSMYGILQDHLTNQTSLLELAIKAGDKKSFDIFVDCQFSSMEEKKRLIDSALKYVFKNHQHKSGERFSSTDVQIIQKLLQYEADVNPHNGPRLIYVAAESGDLQLVELLCTHGADLKTYYPSYQDPVCIAAENGRRDLIELLLKYKANLSSYGFVNSALDCALKNDHTECASLLIQSGARMNVREALTSAVNKQRPKYLLFLFKNYSEVMDYFSQKDTEAMELLPLAAKVGNCEIIGKILDAGVDVNDADSSGYTPLMMSKNGEVAEFLIQRGADVNRETADRKSIETALSHVINHRELVDASTVEVCKVLIDNGAAVNRRSREGKTPLMVAASLKDCVSCLQMLLENGADINDSDHKGNTVLMNAVMSQNYKNVTCLIDSTRDKKGLINTQNNEGLTPLILSVQKNNVLCVKELIGKGADVNMKDKAENTALHHLLITCPWKREEILTSLLEAGSHVNCQNNCGLSPLMLAAKKTKPSVVLLLLDAGADVNSVSKRDTSETALSFLLDFNYKVVLIIETLMNRGANCSYLRVECFHELIIANQTNLIPKLIQHGLGPANIEVYKTASSVRTFCCQPLVTPLLVALLLGHVYLARYFVDILFLTSSDMSMFASNKAIANLLQKLSLIESLSFLQELCSQPMSLVKLCLVVISTAVGSSPGRDTRVDSLPLPQMMKDRLLFKAVAVEDTALGEILSESNNLTEADSEDDYYYQGDDSYLYDHHDHYESTPSDSSDESD
ncbi:unnamed protein product [Candidula unifasciata]|uniref:SOCS box domain-containing protein n=1 Tax=Candidula unifasciata TaxID=100452 RepID=A0A8S3YSX1_9EUPU|nr:unnamed protein product [Candidula unifasciata]